MAQLLRAAGNGDLDKVIELRDQWSYQNKKGETALHIAVTEDQLEVVKHLVSNGAPVNMQDKKNRFTPLMLCLAQQPPHFLEMLQVILKGKPDLGATDSTGQTILHLAAQYEEEEAMEIILRAKPKVDAADPKKMTALHVAAGKGSVELVKLLVERGHANVNAVDAKGNSPLHWVCINNGSDAVTLIEYLVSKGAKPVKNGSGNSPLHSEAMHCETSSAWPTAAASALLAAFPDLETDVNKSGLTAQQTFDQGIDAEESAAGKPDQGAHSGAASDKIIKRNQLGSEEFVDNAAAARAAAIARTKKKSAKQTQANGGGLSPYAWAAILLAVLAVVYSVMFAQEAS
ncbi:Dead deah box rna [Globisporangium polare]